MFAIPPSCPAGFEAFSAPLGIPVPALLDMVELLLTMLALLVLGIDILPTTAGRSEMCRYQLPENKHVGCGWGSVVKLQ